MISILGRLRGLPVQITTPIQNLASRTGLWQTLGGAVSWAGKYIGKPVGAGLGLLGLSHLGSMGIKELREAFGIETETQKMEKYLEFQKQALENAEKELALSKEYLNMLRQAQDPNYQPYRQMPGYLPEWSNLLPFGNVKTPEQKAGFDWSLLLLVGAVGLIAYAVVKGGKK